MGGVRVGRESFNRVKCEVHLKLKNGGQSGDGGKFRFEGKNETEESSTLQGGDQVLIEERNPILE